MAELPSACKIPVWQQKRCWKMQQCFKEQFHKDVSFYARAPGRVNLIGEHIDYCGYGVLPMAIQQDILIAVSVNSLNVIRMYNTNPKYKLYTCDISAIAIKTGSPDWYDYVLCGYKAVIDHYCCQPITVSDFDSTVVTAAGLDMVVCGNIPEGAGLSSSSALVSCSVLATVYAHSIQLSKVELSGLACEAECYVSTEDGGMDQAISFLAEPKTAKLIEFNPLRTSDVLLPTDVTFVISHSCVEVNKAITSYYNTRVAECRLACQMLAKYKGLDWREIKELRDLQIKLNLSLTDMLQLLCDKLHTGAYNKQEICDILEVTQDDLNCISLNEKSYKVAQFELYDRAKHVFEEARRVLQFKEECQFDKMSVNKLGQLMYESHSSCQQLFDCSCKQLDELVSLARNCGAFGSRLTGAGWGGCVVSMVKTDQVSSFLDTMKQGYYMNHQNRKFEVSEVLFATHPGGGACIYTNE